MQVSPIPTAFALENRILTGFGENALLFRMCTALSAVIREQSSQGCVVWGCIRSAGQLMIA